MVEAFSNVRRSESRFEGAGGRSLFCRDWTPPDPKRILVVVHGFGEHSGRYEHLALSFAQHGYVVFSYDQFGHGQSAGPRGHVESFGDFLDDLEVFIARCQSAHPSLPLVLLGHSMGGLVVAGLVTERDPKIDLLVTSGAALALSPDMSRIKLVLAGLMRRIWPTLGMEAGLNLDGLSRDPDVRARYEADPLVHGRATASMGAEMTAAIERASGGAGRVPVPVLMLHGEEDPLCAPSGTRHFFDGLPHNRVKGSAIHIYPHLRHEIFNEPEHEQIFADIRTWIDDRSANLHANDPAKGAQV